MLAWGTQTKWASSLEWKLEQDTGLKLGSTDQPAHKWVAAGSFEEFHRSLAKWKTGKISLAIPT